MDIENGAVDAVANGSNQGIWIAAIVIFIILIILIIIGVIVANNQNGGLGDNCSKTSDCDSGLICQNRSNPDSNSNKKCLSQEGAKCSTSSNCVSSLNCINGKCTA
uniref:Transmembrane protein n=1 Tax=Pithovirus LCPAC406 TaxID=2506599 RepID=A0A481ZDT8_9VIRU|nr:MAG: transmembrane protein [Pithovirus LCPAC406]